MELVNQSLSQFGSPHLPLAPTIYVSEDPQPQFIQPPTVNHHGCQERLEEKNEKLEAEYKRAQRKDRETQRQSKLGEERTPGENQGAERPSNSGETGNV